MTAHTYLVSALNLFNIRRAYVLARRTLVMARKRLVITISLAVLVVIF